MRRAFPLSLACLAFPALLINAAAAAEGFVPPIPRVFIEVKKTEAPMILHPLPVARVFAGNEVTLTPPTGMAAGSVVLWRGRDGIWEEGESFPLGPVGREHTGTYHATVRAPGEAAVPHWLLLTVLDPDNVSAVLNYSSRVRLSAPGDSVTAGFVIASEPLDSRTLIRAVGPGLTAFGVDRPLPDPQVEVFGAGGSPLFAPVSGPGAIDGPAAEAAGAVGAFPLDPTGVDVAVLTGFRSGIYTVRVTSPSGSSGEVLLEIYTVPIK
jgi:hypothetical protein